MASSLLLLVLLTHINFNFRCCPPETLLTSFPLCWSTFPANLCRKWSGENGSDSREHSAQFAVDGARIYGQQPFLWSKKVNRRRIGEEDGGGGKLLDDSLPASLLFQLADVSAGKSREGVMKNDVLRSKEQIHTSDRRNKNSPKSKERRRIPSTNSRSVEKGIKPPSHSLTLSPFSAHSHHKHIKTLSPTTISTSPNPPKAVEYLTTTEEPQIDERKRSASEEEGEPEKGQRQKGASSRPSPVGQIGPSAGNGHHNVTTLSSRHHKKYGKGTQQQKGGAGVGNWHELSSAEQSIAMMLRCQDLDTRELLPSAVTCRNLRSDKVCNYLFHEIDKKNGRRDVKCNLQGLEDIAESCRKSCGICCEDINYACEDDKNGIIDCSRQLDKCHQKKWFGVLSRFCAGTCGLCAMTLCRDYDNSCRVRKALCLRSESVDYMRENCARTCGFCVVGEEDGGEQPPTVGRKKGGGSGGKGQQEKMTENSGKPVVVERPLAQHKLVVPECTDKASNCTTNAHLCGKPEFSEYMVKFCTKTCLKCGQPHSTAMGEANEKSNKKPTENGNPDQSIPVPPPIEVVIQPLASEKAARMARKCEDQHEKCVQWKKEGLCKPLSRTNSNGSKEAGEEGGKVNKLCKKSCGLCS